ncbi:MAG: hypothetical protein K2L94_04665, partial [Alphaproteobacteria bacterium]|nr:hypothetical protein [Alphaproteobacteria bacterium]
IGQPVFIPARCSAQEFEDARKNMEDFMVRQLREMDAEFGLYHVEQDQRATEFKRQKRERKQAKKQARALRKK